MTTPSAHSKESQPESTTPQRSALPTLDQVLKASDRALLPQGWTVTPSSALTASAEPVTTLRVHLDCSDDPVTLPQVLIGRLLASLLRMLPPTFAERAQAFSHQDGSITLSFGGSGWSLELSADYKKSTETHETLRAHIRGRTPSGRQLTDHVVLDWREAIASDDINESMRGGSADIETDAARADSPPALMMRWRHAAHLGHRALHAQIAQSPRGAHIDGSAYLHPTVEITGAVEVGARTRIWHFSKLLGPLTIGERCSFGQNVVVERGVSIGDNVKVQNNVSIYSGVILEDDVFCGPSMVFTNVGTPRSHYPRRDAYSVTRVGRGASIGANATVVCGHQLGRYCFVGAGAVVTRDVPDFALVYGNPARIRGWTCYCGVKLTFTDRVSSAPAEDQRLEVACCEECGRSYEKRGEIVTPTAPLESESS